LKVKSFQQLRNVQIEKQIKNKIMANVKEVKSGLIEREEVIKAPVIKEVPVVIAVEVAVEEVKVDAGRQGNSTRAYRSK